MSRSEGRGQPGCLVQLPMRWVIGGVAVLLHGVQPRRAVAAWAVAGAVLLIGWVGPALGGVLTGLAVVLVAAGLAGLRRRDIAA